MPWDNVTKVSIASVVIIPITIPASAAENTTLIPQPDRYNVVWTSQSKNSGGSMPVGGGGIGLNVWVENGDNKDLRYCLLPVG